MKYITLVAAIAFFFSPTSAIASDDDGFCATVEAFAQGIMMQRQNGGSFSDMMSKARTGDSWQGLLVEMTKQAFNEPRWYSEEMIDRVSSDFANQWAADCYKARTAPKTKKPSPRRRSRKR